MSIHPQIIERAGQKEFVVLPYSEFLEIQQMLEDYEDLQALRAEKIDQKDAPTQSLEDFSLET